MKGLLVFVGFAVVVISAWLLSRAGFLGGTRTTFLRDIAGDLDLVENEIIEQNEGAISPEQNGRKHENH